MYVQDDVDEDEDDDVADAVEDDRVGPLTQAPRLMMNAGYATTSSGGRSIIKVWFRVADTDRRIL